MRKKRLDRKNDNNINVLVSPHRRELQISVVIGHVVEHVGHGDHHRWVGGLLLIILTILLLLLLFLWLLETLERKKNKEALVENCSHTEFRKKMLYAH